MLDRATHEETCSGLSLSYPRHTFTIPSSEWWCGGDDGGLMCGGGNCGGGNRGGGGFDNKGGDCGSGVMVVVWVVVKII